MLIEYCLAEIIGTILKPRMTGWCTKILFRIKQFSMSQFYVLDKNEQGTSCFNQGDKSDTNL